jgi:signal transduction histidine kinase
VIRADDGRPIRMFGALQDVSRQKTIEEELGRSEALSSTVLSSLSARIGVLDADGVIVQVNDDWQRFEEEFHRGDATPCGVGSHYPKDCARLFGPAAARYERAAQAVLKRSRPSASLEYQLPTPGDERWFLFHVAPLRTDAGGTVISHVEVTAGKRAAELEIRARAAEESERVKGSLISTVSHELRTPLAVIRGHVSAALEYGNRMPPERLRQSLEAADHAAQQLERLVSDLLTVGRLEAGMLRMERQPEPVNEILAEAIEGIHGLAPNRAITVKAPCTAVMALLDRARMLQVFYNLLDNAVKYSPPDTPIEVSVRRSNRRVRITLLNQGNAVPRRETSAIFDRYHRTEGGKHLNVAGEGLGLAISKAIVEAHGGVIKASVPRRGGLCVVLTLPAAPEPGG